MSSLYAYSIPYANFMEFNERHGIDTATLLATPITGHEVAGVIKRWKRMVQSTHQLLINARAAYMADHSSENYEAWSKYSIAAASTPGSLHFCLESAKARDETRRRRKEANRIYKEERKAIGTKYAQHPDAEKMKEDLADAEDRHFRAWVRAYVSMNMLPA
jgi:hypothetical protein